MDLHFKKKTEALASEAFFYTNALMEQANRFFTALLFLGMNYHNPMQKTGSMVKWN